GDFADKNIISVKQFDRQDVEALFIETEDMEAMVRADNRSQLLADHVVANLFYQPSTRTFLSFEAAAQRLGAGTISTQGVEYSSISKGETLEDTIRTVAQYADTVTLRHPEKGSASRAARAADVPVINGGDGTGEHPTQALLDLYTIEEEFESVDGLTVTMLGDLKHGRTVHSLARLLALYDVRLNYVSPEQLTMPQEIIDELNGTVTQAATTDLREVIGDSDVLYVTRVQEEYFNDPEEYATHKGGYVVDEKVMRAASDDMIVMHPLPRIDEIHPSVDHDPRAVYFDQVENGMFVRMALLALVNGRSIEEA
ncbi:MAG TPA: aspartate carbamoyltransferase, partial [Candidatus Saccharimonadales bacterium]|nr:aspartate carbamoyltransferase [Candidatus Saccharimonadales bacterium]